ncbi:helix-turn-helix transcriptional regulator [Actinoallomurus vinaceus]|uniref:Helix-turn-helix transcriptional regulator n=1 Tax=Actinoallomurus vinaceus TaxID=1080074 RepID=A0ABP8UNA4_9ACTN
MTYTPTLRARRVARELKHLRKERKLTGDDVCRLLGWDTSKLSRMENANMRTTSGEVMELLEVYGITGPRRQEMIQLARDARKKGWWQDYTDEVKAGFSDYLALEDEAQTYRAYDVQLIPGPFQTEEYMRAIYRGARPRTEAETQRMVEVRLARKERLTSSVDSLHVIQVIEEAALRRIVGGRGTMRAQLNHLLELGDLANISIQVVPYRAGVHAAIDGPFILLTFDSYPDVLYVEHLMGCLYLEMPEETTRGSLVFDHLRASALNASDSRALIKEVARDF